MDVTGLIIVVARSLFAMVFVLTFIPVLIWAERKGAAFIQDRPGPNRADIFGIRLAGLVQPLPDVVKLLFKEDLTPRNVYQPHYTLAPIIAMTVALVTFAVVPFADDLVLGGRTIDVQASSIDTGLLYTLAIGSLGVYGIMLAGWSSNNKYSLLGGLRSSAQLISYELTMGLAVGVMFLLYSSARLDEIVAGQSANPLSWGALSIPGFLAFIMFATSSFAETNRLPFDLPEGESELVAGYHVEYSAFKFAMFFMAEYVNMVVAAGIMTTLFFGGYQVPFLPTETLISHAPLVMSVVGMGGFVVMAALGSFAFTRYKPGDFGDNRDREPLVVGAGLWALGILALAVAFLPGRVPLVPGYDNHGVASIAAAVLQLGTFTGKVLFFTWCFIWVRWTLPRFRYDQLMRLGWNYLLPIGIANLVVAGVFAVAFPEGSLLRQLGLGFLLDIAR